MKEEVRRLFAKLGVRAYGSSQGGFDAFFTDLLGATDGAFREEAGCVAGDGVSGLAAGDSMLQPGEPAEAGRVLIAETAG